MYMVGFPGWKIAARLNVPLLLRVHVERDHEANVLVATSPDLKGLVVEAETRERLIEEVFSCVDMLLTEQLKRPLKNRPSAAWTDELIAA